MREKTKIHCDFCTPPDRRFLDCNCMIVHCWIGFMTWNFVLSGWIIKTKSREGDKYFTLFCFVFGVFNLFVSYLWALVLWLIICMFCALVGDLFVSFVDHSGAIWLVLIIRAFYPCFEGLFTLKICTSLVHFCGYIFTLFLLIFLAYSY